MQAWVAEQGSHELQYIADRIRTPGEVNGKSANLNNALNHIFPPGTSIGYHEVRQLTAWGAGHGWVWRLSMPCTLQTQLAAQQDGADMRTSVASAPVRSAASGSSSS